MLIRKYEDITIIEESEKNDVIVKIDDNFYDIDAEDVKKYIQNRKILSEYEIKDNIFICMVLCSFIIFVVMYYLFHFNYKIIDTDAMYATILLLLNIPLHEMGHVLATKMFCKNAKIKMGVTIAFINPAFYVDTSYSYMCPRYKRISIYLAGNFMNALFLFVIMLLTAEF